MECNAVPPRPQEVCVFMILFPFPFSVVLACVSVWVHSLRSDLKNRVAGRGTTQRGTDGPRKSFQESLREEQSSSGDRPAPRVLGCGPLTFQSCWWCGWQGDCRTPAERSHVRVARRCVYIHNSLGCTQSRRNTGRGVLLGAGRTVMWHLTLGSASVFRPLANTVALENYLTFLSLSPLIWKTGVL